MASQQTSGFGTFGFDTPSNSIETAFGWGNQSTNQEKDNSGFGLWTPSMFSESLPSEEYKRTKDQIIEDLKIQLKSQEEESKKQKYHIDHLNKIIDNLNVDMGIKNQTIKTLQNENEELKYEQQSTVIVTNQSSIRTAVLLLNSPQNYHVSSNYTKVVVFSSRAKQYFTCLKLWDGKWTEGNLYNNPIHNLTSVELF